MLACHVDRVVLPFETLENRSYSALFQVQSIRNLSEGVVGSVEVRKAFIPVVDDCPQLSFGKRPPRIQLDMENLRPGSYCFETRLELET